jgi:hypothetical protein
VSRVRFTHWAIAGLVGVIGIRIAAAAVPIAMPCDPVTEVPGQFGPFDYRVVKDGRLRIVEKHHFSSKTESLAGGDSGRLPNGDIAYTLGKFPNHHRALQSLINLSMRERSNKLRDMPFGVECYFERAIHWLPDDGQLHVLYGIYLYKAGKKDEAMEELSKGEELAPDSANLHYNLGLLYFDMKEYDKSLSHAKAAYARGFPLPGLKRKLAKAGKWKD